MLDLVEYCGNRVHGIDLGARAELTLYGFMRVRPQRPKTGNTQRLLEHDAAGDDLAENVTDAVVVERTGIVRNQTRQNTLLPVGDVDAGLRVALTLTDT